MLASDDLLWVALSIDPSKPANDLPEAFLHALSVRLGGECLIASPSALDSSVRLDPTFFLPLGMPEASRASLCMRYAARDWTPEEEPIRISLGELGELVLFPPPSAREDFECEAFAALVQHFAVAWEAAAARERAQDAVGWIDVASGAAHIGFWTLDPDRARIRLNPEALRLLELEPDVENGIRLSTFLERVHPQDRERVKATLENYANQGAGDYLEFQFRIGVPGGKGRKFHAYVGHHGGSPDQRSRPAGAFIDVTETELSRSGALDRSSFEALILSLTMELINAPIEEIDGVIASVLKQGAQFVGADRAYRIDYDWENELATNTHEWCAEGIEPQIDQLQEVSVVDLGLWTSSHRKGLPFYVSSVTALAVGHPLRELLEPQGIKSLVTLPLMDGGRCFGFIGFDAVRTQHHWTEVEIALLQLLAELIANAEERRGRELDLRQSLREQRRAKEAAQEMAQIADHANEAKSRFVATVSHEIRTPLHAILGTTELLGHSPLDAAQRHYVETLSDAGRNLSVLVEDMLDFARIETGKIVIETQALSLDDLAARVVDQLQPQARRKGLDLHGRVDPRVPAQLMGDELRLQQILLNLVENAIKYTEQGRVDLSLELAPQQESGAVGVLFRVRDTGMGIAPEDREQLFHPFYQGKAAIELRNTGTGLGLSIVHNLVSLMGGTIQVESVLGQGTTFTVRLWFQEPQLHGDGHDAQVPALEAPVPTLESVEPGPGEVRDLKGARILLAEDNRMNQMLVQAHLRDQGCVLTIVENGREAVTACEQEPFDLVLMDCRMPVLDGFEATRAIRAGNAPMASVPIIAVTANAMRSDMDRCTAVGMTDFLGKPFTREQLLEVMRNALMSPTHGAMGQTG
jgi:signal transduction histidine kinase/CheY-like chemotaxis protein/PAS domain-containing protein